MIEEVKELLQKGKTKAALKQLAEHTDKATVLLNRFASAETRVQLSLIDYDEFSMIQAQIVHAALQVLNNYEEATKEMASDESPETKNADEPNTTLTEHTARTKSTIKRIIIFYAPENVGLKMRLMSRIKEADQGDITMEWEAISLEKNTSAETLRENVSPAHFGIVLLSKELLDYINDERPLHSEILQNMDRKEQLIILLVDEIDWTLWPIAHKNYLPEGDLPILAYANLDAALKKAATQIVQKIKHQT